MPDYIQFALCVQEPGRKTQTWAVNSADSKFRLGEVRWYPAWRRYCYFPQGGTVYDPGCLTKIAEFCERETQARK